MQIAITAKRMSSISHTFCTLALCSETPDGTIVARQVLATILTLEILNAEIQSPDLSQSDLFLSSSQQVPAPETARLLTCEWLFVQAGFPGHDGLA